MIRQWKDERSIPERRRRDDKLEDYLTVWDLREGWVTDHYDNGRERSLGEIAVALKLSVSTVSNRYQSAFRCIVGHEYNPELWAQLFVPLKLNRWHASETPPNRSEHRPWRSRQHRAVPESTLAPSVEGRSESGFLHLLGVDADEFRQLDLFLDVQTLIEKGHSNAEILDKLELDAQFGEYIDYLRKRDDTVSAPSDH